MKYAFSQAKSIGTHITIVALLFTHLILLGLLLEASVNILYTLHRSRANAMFTCWLVDYLWLAPTTKQSKKQIFVVLFSHLLRRICMSSRLLLGVIGDFTLFSTFQQTFFSSNKRRALGFERVQLSSRSGPIENLLLARVIAILLSIHLLSRWLVFAFLSRNEFTPPPPHA